jgi:acetyl esterase
MSDPATPFVPPARPNPADRAVRWLVAAAVRASLVVSPWPVALLVRKVFASSGAQVAHGLSKHAPPDVVSFVDQRYGAEEDMLLDVYRPGTGGGPWPLVVWAHGGGWVGGSKEELASYFELIASNGYVVAGPRYSLAPEHHYPAPPRQVMQALRYLQVNAERFQVDTSRVVVAGDSAGAQIAAQIGALVTTPGYAEAVGITPSVTRAQLRGLVLACGPYDLGLARQVSTPAGQRFIKAILWAYLGKRDFFDDPSSATWSVTDNVTADFPPTLITVGNADPLRPHSELLTERLRAEGVEVETLFWPDAHPPLAHEYQFDLDSEPGQRFLNCMLAFLLGTAC